MPRLITARPAFVAGIALALVAAAFALVGSSGAASAQSTPSDAAGGGWPLWIQGRPLSLEAGAPNGYYFWHDADGLHIRTTTPADRLHPFQAVLTTDGAFRDVQKIRLEGADDIALSADRTRLVIKFHTWNGMDGVDFKIDGGHRLTLRLEEFGLRVPTAKIYAGRYSVHPSSNPFTVYR